MWLGVEGVEVQLETGGGGFESWLLEVTENWVLSPFGAVRIVCRVLEVLWVSFQLVLES